MKNLIRILPLLCVSSAVVAQSNDAMLARLDSLTAHLYFKEEEIFEDSVVNYYTSLTPEQLPVFTEEEYTNGLKTIPAVIPLPYNKDVGVMINYFMVKKRAYVVRMLTQSRYYFPLFEEVLNRKGMPTELKVLPVIESAFNPTIQSKAGATGLWQIMFRTGQILGLKINSYVDERMDPVRSTEAATNYLKQLYGMYGDWHLALAAYNAGPGNVNKAIAKAGGSKDYWVVRNYLPVETQKYVPSYIAAVYMMNRYKEHKLFPSSAKLPTIQTDTVMIYNKVSLKHVSSTLGLETEYVQFLNPSLKLGVIPASQEGFALHLPVSVLTKYEQKKADILADPAYCSPVIATQTVLASAESILPGTEAISQVFTYIVKAGDNLNTIAKKFNCSVEQLMEWNGLSTTVLPLGQIMTMHISKQDYEGGSGYKLDAGTTVAKTTSTVTSSSSTKPKQTYYKVRYGDSLWSISKKYGVELSALKSANGITSNSYKLIPGKSLKIPN